MQTTRPRNIYTDEPIRNYVIKCSFLNVYYTCEMQTRWLTFISKPIYICKIQHLICNTNTEIDILFYIVEIYK